MPFDPLKAIPESPEIQHSAAAYLSGIIVSEARFSFFTLRLLGTGDSVKFLSSIPDTTVTELDAGCCGMAGSFGYEREHYAISQAIGERKLFPAIRDRTEDAIVVAPRFSCRHQIRHFTGVEAVSTVEWLQSVIEVE